MTKDELIQVLNALEEAKTELGEWSLEVNKEDYNNPRLNDAIALINKTLEEIQSVSPEPDHVWGVDWGKAGDSPCVSIIKRLPGGGIEVVAVEYGPKREPLTDEEIKRMAAPLFMSHYWSLCNEFARAIEAAHGIKGVRCE